MIKLLIKLVGAVVVLFVIGVVVLYFGIDSIVKKTVEVEGTDQLKVATTLDGVSLGLLRGSVDLTGFSLGSPAGFSAPKMMSAGELKVDAGGIGHLREKPIHINTIDIESPQFVVEEANGKLNYKAMMENLPSSPSQTSAPPSQSKEMRVVIDLLTIKNADVQMDLNVGPVKKHYDVKLPSITMKNLGNADGQNKGVAVKDVVTAVIAQLVANASKSAGIPPEVSGLLDGNLSDVKDKLTDAAKQQLPPSVGNLINGLGKQPATGQPATPGQPAGNPLQSLENQAKNKLKIGQ